MRARLGTTAHFCRVVVPIGEDDCFAEMCSAFEAGSYLKLIDSCVTQLEAQGPSRTCNESEEEEKNTPSNVVA